MEDSLLRDVQFPSPFPGSPLAQGKRQASREDGATLISQALNSCFSLNDFLWSEVKLNIQFTTFTGSCERLIPGVAKPQPNNLIEAG